MDKLMDNANLWHLRDHIFEDLSLEDVLNCRRVCKYWNKSLRRMSDVKFIQEFGDRIVEQTQPWLPDPEKKLSTIITGWKNAALHRACYCGQTETAKLIIKNSKKIDIDLNAKDKWDKTAWHWACYNGKTETAQLVIKNSKEFGIDLNAKNYNGSTAWHLACRNGQTETAQVIIQNSKKFDIDLNAKDDYGRRALHVACIYGRTETIQMILKNWKEFGIDIKVQNNNCKTALDIIDEEDGEEYDQIKKMLEKEYSKIDVTESVQSLNVE